MPLSTLSRSFVGRLARPLLWCLALCGTAQLAALDRVSAIATVPVAREAGAVPGVITIVRSGTNGALTVDIATTSGTAMAGSDYVAIAATVVFADGEGSKAVTITPIDDFAIEGREGAIISIVTSPTTAYIVGSSPAAEVSIADDDMTATLSVPDPLADEDVSLVGIAIDPQIRRRGVVRVDYSSTARAKDLAVEFTGTATLNTDYVATYKISASASSRMGTELAGTTTGLNYSVVAFLPGSTVVTIKDSDSTTGSSLLTGSTISFGSDTTVYAVTAGNASGNGAITVSPGLAAPLENATVINVLTVLGGGTGSDDLVVSRVYSVGATTVDVANGIGGIFVGDAFSIAGDTNLYVATNVVAGANGSLAFSRYVSSGAGGAGLGVAISSNQPVSTIFTASTGITNITVPSSSTKVEFSFAPIADGVVEGAELATMTLLASQDYSISNPTQASIVVADRDVIANVVLGANAGKPNMSGFFRVSFSQAFPTDITVGYSVSPAGAGVATPGLVSPDDYLTLPGTITVPAGQTFVDIAVQPINSPAPIAAETVTITMNASNDFKLSGSSSSGLNPSATCNITGSLGVVGVVATLANAAEGSAPVNGSFTVSIARPVGLSGIFTVSYTIAGTAVPNVRYVPLSGSVTFAAAQTTATVLVSPIDNLVVDGTQVVTITLQPGQGYSLNGAAQTAQINILDDEPVVSVVRILDGAKPSTPGSFQISYPGVPAGSALNRNLTVFYTFSGNAVAGTDFTTSSSVTLPAGTRTANVPIIPTAATDADQTVTLTIIPDAAYGIGTASASLTLFRAATLEEDKPVPGSEPSDLNATDCGNGSGIGLILCFGLLGLGGTRIRRRRAA